MPDTCSQLALLNVAYLRAPLTDPVIREFVDLLNPVMQRAEGCDGFVWRRPGYLFKLRLAGDDRILGTLSVWESVAAAEAFVYGGPHRAALKRRHDWFVSGPLPPTACWWVPYGHRPSLAEAEQRLGQLHCDGAGSTAFPLAAARDRTPGD